MKSAPESVQASLHLFFEAAAADLEVAVENLSTNSGCLPQSRNQQGRGVARVLSYTTSILLPTLTSLFQHLGLQNYGVDLLGKDHRDANLKIYSYICSYKTKYLSIVKLKPTLHVFSCHVHLHFYGAKLDEQLVSTPLKSLRDTLPSILPCTSLKLALIKCLGHGHKATGAYCLLH